MPLSHDQLVLGLLQRRGAVLGFITSIVGDVHLAEDLYQEVAVLATQKQQEIESEEHLVGWLMHTARFLSLNASRKRQSGRHVFDSDLLNLLETEWQDEGRENQEGLLHALRECLGRLTPRAQSLVQLRYAEGLSGEELARRVDRTVNAVYVSLSRIHRTLARCVRRTRAQAEG